MQVSYEIGRMIHFREAKTIVSINMPYPVWIRGYYKCIPIANQMFLLDHASNTIAIPLYLINEKDYNFISSYIQTN